MRSDAREFFRQLVESTGNALARTAFALTRDRHLAEDVCQETWLALYRSFRAAVPIANYQGWLRAVVVRKAWAAVRRRHIGRRHMRSLEALEAWREPTRGWRDDPAADVALHEALDSLPADLREAVTLKVLAGLSYGAVADALGCSKETAWRRVQGALAELGRAYVPEPPSARRAGRCAADDAARAARGDFPLPRA